MAKKYMVVGGRGNGGGSGSTTNYADLENKPSINNVTLTGNKTTSDLGIVIPTATSDLNNDSGFITSSDIPAQVQSDWNESDATSPAYIDNKPTIPTATSDLNNDSGFITSSDIPAQVQSDWNESDSNDPAYIQNKPTIPVAPVQSNWNEADTNSLAYIQNKPTIPTATSDLNNDSGFITSSDIPAQVQSDWNEADTTDPAFIQNKPTIPTATSDLNNDSGFITSSDVPAQVQSDWNEADTTDPAYIQNKPTIPAAPVQSNWNEADSSSLAYIQNKPSLATVATSGSYTDLSNTPTIPTATSDLNNDSGFITSSDIPAQVQSDWNEADSSDPAYIQNKPTIPAAQVNSDWNAVSGVSQILNKPSLATVATSGSYTDLTNTPTIPTATSDLNNDSGFITSSDIPAQVQSDWNEADSNDPAYIQNKPTIPAAPVQSNWNESDTNSLAYIQNKPTIPAAPVQSNWNEADSSSLAYIQNKPPMTTETWTFTLSNKTTITRTVYIVPSYRVHVTNSYSPSVELEYSYDDDTYTTTTDFDEYLDAGTSVWFRVTSSGSMPGEYEFTGWSDGWIDPDGGDGTIRRIAVTGNVTLSVEAEEIQLPSTGAELSVTVYEDGVPEAENGCGVIIDGSFYTEYNSYVPDGYPVTIQAKSGEYYEFDHWVFQGDFDSEDMPDTTTDTITFTVYNGMHYNVDALFSSVEE